MKRISIALILAAASSAAHADFIGLYLGGGSWKSDFEGNIIANVGLDTDLNVDGTNATYFYAALEHPIPLVPNIRFDHTSIDDTGTGTLTGGLSFGGQFFPVNTVVDTLVDVTHTDLTLYYELIDTGFDFDVGLTGRTYDGEIAMAGGGLIAQSDLEGTIPMLYVRAKVGLPFTGTYIDGNLRTLGSRHSDYNVGIGWETENFILPEVGIQAGYRNMKIDLDQDDIDVNVDTTFDGFYITLNAHF